MDFELPEELRILKSGLRRFVDNELIPIERQTTDGEALKPEYLERFEQRARDIGIWQLDVPEEYGGGGMPILARAIVWEELSRTIAIPARGEGITGPSARGILYSLTGEMKEKYLLPLLRGEKKSCFAQTEPDAGSDPGGMRTTAVQDGDHYVINGVKRFITGAADADFMQLMVATDRSKGSRGGISCFIVDMDTPGVKLGACYETMMGDKPWEIVLESVRVPATHRVGEEGDGMRFGQQWLNIGRVKHGALRPAARRPPGGAVDAGRHVHRVAGRPPARLQDRSASRPGRRGARRRLRRKIFRRRDGVQGCRPMHADPRRDRAHD
jgi:acyl-CoA dehydrogenase